MSGPRCRDCDYPIDECTCNGPSQNERAHAAWALAQELAKANQRIAELEKLVEVFIRKGEYHMMQWPDDKEMRSTLDDARAKIGKVGGG